MPVQNSRYMFRFITLMVFFLYLWMYYPGYMSHDSAVHYQQIKSGQWTTYQPILFLILWWMTDLFIEGPGGIFLLLLITFFYGAYLYLQYQPIRAYKKMLGLFVIALFPFNVLLLPHVWKDIAVIAFVFLSLGFHCKSLKDKNLIANRFALLCYVMAVMCRFESVLYLWPLLWFLLSGVKPKLKRSVMFIAIIGTVFLVNVGLEKISDSRKITLWPTIALWDMAAVSIVEERVLIPDFAVGDGMTISDLSQATMPWSNVPLFSSTKAGVFTGIEQPYSEAQYHQMMRQWIGLPFQYPVAYFNHRIRLLKELLRIVESAEKPKTLYYVHQMKNHEKQFIKNDTWLNDLVSIGVDRYIDSWLFKPWVYFMILIVVIPGLLYGGRFSFSNPFNIPLLSCAILNVLVMWVLAPAAEIRYLLPALNFGLLLMLNVWLSKPNIATQA